MLREQIVDVRPMLQKVSVHTDFSSGSNYSLTWSDPAKSEPDVYGGVCQLLLLPVGLPLDVCTISQASSHF